jgi:carboxymethylenebutenolidase
MREPASGALYIANEMMMRPRMVLLTLLLAGVAVAQPASQPTESAVKLKAGKASVRAVLLRPAGAGPFPAVVMLHGDFGLTAWVKQQARRVAETGYLVLAVDRYGGELPRTIEDAHILDRGLEDERVIADTKAAIDYLAGHKDTRKDAIGVLGWDSGGGFALDTAIADRRLKTAVVCYGRLTTDPRPLANLQGPVLGIFGGKDPGIPPETIAQFKQAMTKAGKSAIVHVYPECGSCFMEPDSPHFEGQPDRAAIADAWAKLEAHLGKTLGR